VKDIWKGRFVPRRFIAAETSNLAAMVSLKGSIVSSQGHRPWKDDQKYFGEPRV